MVAVFEHRALTARQRVVLRAIIHTYVDTTQPVGSSALTRRYRLGVSPATVRNVMGDLEDMGLISQPHTSAGRVPTDVGYRTYVDELMPDLGLPQDDQSQITTAVVSYAGLLEDQLKSMVGLLATLSPYTAMIQLPEDATLRIREVHLLDFTSDRVVVVIATVVGTVRHRVIELANRDPDISLERMSSFLTRQLAYSPLGDAASRLAALELEGADIQKLRDACLEVARQLLEPGSQGMVLLDGASHLMEQPEFQDGRRARALLRLLEEQSTLVSWLSDESAGIGTDRPVRFQIGIENPPEDAHRCSLATVPFQVGTASGRLALLGPTRMRYTRAAALLEFAAARLTEQLAA